MFRNLVSVLRLIGQSKPAPFTPGLKLLLAASTAEIQGGSSSSGSGNAYMRRELCYAWECLQKEAQGLLSELLQPGELQANMRDFKTGIDFLPAGQYRSQTLAHNQMLVGYIIWFRTSSFASLR